MRLLQPSALFITLLIVFLIYPNTSSVDGTSVNTTDLSLDGVYLCQSNCESVDRLVGPTRPTDTRQYPWAIAPFPSKKKEFCKLGCQLFFSELPNNSSCKANCDWFYRFDATEHYSNLAVEAKLECYDGCDIAYKVCQAGYYCSSGSMLPCPAGTFRTAVTGMPNSTLVNETLATVHQCVGCPYGTYRPSIQGKASTDCTKCPIGKYLNATGSVAETQCQRCPAGMFGQEEGMRTCLCIDKESCDLSITIPQVGTNDYFKDGMDYYRETIPYIGRW